MKLHLERWVWPDMPSRPLACGWARLGTQAEPSGSPAGRPPGLPDG